MCVDTYLGQYNTNPSVCVGTYWGQYNIIIEESKPLIPDLCDYHHYFENLNPLLCVCLSRWTEIYYITILWDYTTAVEIALNMASLIDFNLVFLPFEVDVGANNGQHGTSIFGLFRQVVALHRSFSTRLVQLRCVATMVMRLLL